MKYKILFFLMMFANVCFAQNVYKYKNIEITCKSNDGNVSLTGRSFILKDSIATIEVTFYELHPFEVSIINTSKEPIKFLWKDFMAYSNYKNYCGKINSDNVDDSRGGEQYIYVGDFKSFTISPFWINRSDMFPKKANGSGFVSLTLVRGGKSFKYYLEFTSKVVR